MKLTMPRDKHAFPPTAMLRYLNALLRDDGAARRLVACDDGVPWEGHDGSAVVFIDTSERERLVAAGVTVHEDRDDDPRIRVESAR